MKAKSSKLIFLEKSRKSLLTANFETCYLCGGSKNHIHEIFEGAYRIASMQYGCCIPVCWRCHSVLHSNRSIALEIKRKCETAFIELYGYDLFMSVFKIDYYYK